MLAAHRLLKPKKTSIKLIQQVSAGNNFQKTVSFNEEAALGNIILVFVISDNNTMNISGFGGGPWSVTYTQIEGSWYFFAFVLYGGVTETNQTTATVTSNSYLTMFEFSGLTDVSTYPGTNGSSTTVQIGNTIEEGYGLIAGIAQIYSVNNITDQSSIPWVTIPQDNSWMQIDYMISPGTNTTYKTNWTLSPATNYATILLELVPSSAPSSP